MASTKIIEEMKVLMKEMFRKQEESVTKIISSNAVINKKNIEALSKQVSETNNKTDSIYEMYKEVKNEIDDIKLSLEATQDIHEQKLNKLEGKLKTTTNEMNEIKNHITNSLKTLTTKTSVINLENWRTGRGGIICGLWESKNARKKPGANARKKSVAYLRKD